MLWPTRLTQLPFEVSCQHTESFVQVAIRGEPTLTDIFTVLRQLADDSKSWVSAALLLDLRELCTRLRFTDQFLMGEEIGRSLSHLDMIAVLAGTNGALAERAARMHGANLRVFYAEEQGFDWLLGVAVD